MGFLRRALQCDELWGCVADCGLCHGIKVGAVLATALKGWGKPTPLFPRGTKYVSRAFRPAGEVRARGSKATRGEAEGCLDTGRVKQPGHEE